VGGDCWYLLEIHVHTALRVSPTCWGCAIFQFLRVEKSIKEERENFSFSLSQMAQIHAAAAAPLSLHGVFGQFTARVAEVRAYTGPIMPVLEEQPVEGVLWNQLRADHSLSLVTNFNEAEISDIHQRLLPFIAAASRRGPKPKSSSMDALIIYCGWAKCGRDYLILAKLLGLKASRCEDDVHRMRPILNAALKETWYNHRPRPEIDVDSDFPHVAILIDNHTTACFRPKGRFGDAKTYWDAKNHTYGLKSEVAVDV
jgi:hypothetical protein